MAPPTQATAKKVEGEGDSRTFREAEGLNELLRREPAVRADAVERARDRIGQNDWPPAVAIRQISDLLAVNLYQKN